MAYVLGYFVADGCISNNHDRISNPYTFNITSVDLGHLEKIAKAMDSEYKISKKSGGGNSIAYQIQVRNSILCKDLMNFGIRPRKTYNLEAIDVPKSYFSDFTRGFFDGDGSVYIYDVNNVPQIKSEFVCVSHPFIKRFNKELCSALDISQKTIHKNEYKDSIRIPRYDVHFYIDDSEKLAKFMYDNNPTLYLERKKKVFDKWTSIQRRHYIKKNYPSKIGWHLKEKIVK